jgi:hypothetical protein
MPQRSLWIDRLTESASGWLPTGEKIAVRNEFRHWGEVGKSHKEWGCSNSECRRKLYDRLTLWFLEDYLKEYHLNSGSNLARLRKLETQTTTALPGGVQASLVQGRIVVR